MEVSVCLLIPQASAFRS